MVHDALSSLKALLPLTDAEQTAWLAVARVQSVPAKAPLGRLGEPCTRLTFVNSGLLRVFFLTEDAERTCRFLPEGSWYTDFESFSTGAPSREHLQALEDSEVVQVEKADLERLYQHHPNCWKSTAATRCSRSSRPKRVTNVCARSRPNSSTACRSTTWRRF